MSGLGNIRFTDLLRDNLATHGYLWTIDYYLRHGMPQWELEFWLRSVRKV